MITGTGIGFRFKNLDLLSLKKGEKNGINFENIFSSSNFYEVYAHMLLFVVSEY